MSSRVIEAFAVLKSALSELREAVDEELHQVYEPDLIELMREHHEGEAQYQYIGLEVLTEVRQRSIPERQAATSPQNWLAGLLRLSPVEAKRRVRVAEALANRYRETAAAFAEGVIDQDQASAICSLIDGLPSCATFEQKQLAESLLLENARILDAEGLLACRKRLHDVIDPDGSLEREREAKDKRGAHFRNHGDGTQSFNYRNTDEEMAKLKAALDPLSAPRPEADGEKDERTPGQRRADAMAEVVELALRGDQLPKQRGNRAHVLVTISEENLHTGRGFGVTGSGEDLSAAAIRRIACDAKVTPIIVDGNGVPLAVGRTRRTVTPAQWVALVIRDKGCIFPGCDRPAGWCKAHHVIWWEDWGLTDLDNMALLCDHHHESVHHHGWDVEFGKDGHPQLIPPAWIDPLRTPRRNSYWRPLPLDLPA